MLKSSRLWACFRNGRCTTRRTVIIAVIAAVPSSRIEYWTQLFRYQILIWPITKEQSSVVHVLHWHNARCVALRRILEVVVTFWPKWPWKSLSRSSRPVLRRTLNKSWHQLLSDLCSGSRAAARGSTRLTTSCERLLRDVIMFCILMQTWRPRLLAH